MKRSSPNLSTFWISWVTALADKCVKNAFSGLLADVVQLASALGQVCISRDWYCRWKQTDKQTDRIRYDYFILVFHTVNSPRRNFALNELNRIPNVAPWLVLGSVLGSEYKQEFDPGPAFKGSTVSCWSVPREMLLRNCLQFEVRGWFSQS